MLIQLGRLDQARNGSGMLTTTQAAANNQLSGPAPWPDLAFYLLL